MKGIFEHELTLVEERLAETLQVFAAYRTINEAAAKDVNEELNRIVNQRGGFWHAAAIAFQTHLFTGIYALVEPGHKVVTLATILGKLSREQLVKLPACVPESVGDIRKRYDAFRHTLFGHNGKGRGEFVDKFDQAGFTWETISRDLELLEYAFKVVVRVCRGADAPSEKEAEALRPPYAITIERTAVDTRMLLEDLTQSRQE